MTAPPRLRTLVVGDSSTRRQRLAAALTEDAGIEIVASVATMDAGPRVVESRGVDTIVLDATDLPSALAFVGAVMTLTPTPILAVHPLGESSEAREALLAAGVVDVLSTDDAISSDGDSRIVRLVRLVARIRVVTRRTARKVASESSPLPPLEHGHDDGPRKALVAIGASTGGPAAVAEILAGLPASFPLPILVVVHIGPHFGYSFAEWLGTTSKLPVHQATEGAHVLDGHVYVAPPERHLVLRGDHLALTNEAERHSCRPSVDRLFESVAAERGARAIGCLLTGIGKDGATGLLSMRAQGATTIAQDEASCAVFGMPREAIAIGAATKIASPSQIVSILVSGAAALAAAR